MARKTSNAALITVIVLLGCSSNDETRSKEGPDGGIDAGRTGSEGGNGGLGTSGGAGPGGAAGEAGNSAGGTGGEIADSGVQGAGGDDDAGNRSDIDAGSHDATDGDVDDGSVNVADAGLDDTVDAGRDAAADLDASTPVDADTDGSSSIATPPTVDGLIINEFLANDSTADSNCDGVTTAEQDEFIELVNVTANYVDLTGVTISDGSAIRHTFGAQTLPPGEGIVVWSGGAPQCTSAPRFNVATTGALQLNNTSDSITVALGAATLATVAYATSTAGVSSNLTNDSTDTVAGASCGVFINHSLVSGAVGSFSPGVRANGTGF